MLNGCEGFSIEMCVCVCVCACVTSQCGHIWDLKFFLVRENSLPFQR